jgi:hypothetical protein
MSDPDARMVGFGPLVRPSVASLFALFEQACLSGWEPGWRREARIAFYAGFSAALSAVIDIEELPEAEQEAAMGALVEEMNRYVAGVMAAAKEAG